MKVPINSVACIDLEAPVLAAEEIRSPSTGAVRWRVWCKYCDDWHHHGPGEGSPRSALHAAGLAVSSHGLQSGADRTDVTMEEASPGSGLGFGIEALSGPW